MNSLKKIFYAYLGHELKGCHRILDLGCGPSSYLENLPYKGFRYSVGVDGYQPSLDECKRKGLHDEHICVDIMNASFPDKSFDAVMCCQCIEHLTPKDADILLHRMEQWARKKILITTPNCEEGFALAPEDEAHSPGFDRYSDKNLMRHISGWTTDSFRLQGFKVRGYQGNPLNFFFPKKAPQLLAIKTLQ